MRSKKLLLIMLLMFTAIFATACGGNNDSGSSKSENKEPEKSEKSAGNAEVKVLNSEYTLPGDTSANLDKNELVLKVKVSVKNTGNEPLDVDQYQFALYQDNTKVTDVSMLSLRDQELQSADLNKGKSVEGFLYYQVEKGKKYQLEYTPKTHGDKKIDPITFDIDGNQIADTAKNLQDPAKALLAYTDITLYGKDNEDFEKLTGENKREVVSDFLKDFQKDTLNSLDLLYTDKVNKKKLNKLTNTILHVYQEKTKVTAVTTTMTDEEATVEATITPIDTDEALKEVSKKTEEYQNSKGLRFYDEKVKNASLDFMNEEVKKSKTASSSKTVEVRLKKDDDGKWQLDFDRSSDYFDSFVKN
ncbi:DUF5105 domain-containing protein [Bacillus sp. CLL-7-23]|uniref:DUF5105 domain-containing protein n=1 Tax=Bacillus changyiensis TaxID=3004103 RepID=A0ABT4X3R8_9BACI|nr:DUF5105 domain-containing protein [Bacillus changyiensis]MDA7026399.1 DUF5105 domain-containing protein [Bacillus changyiensis]